MFERMKQCFSTTWLGRAIKSYNDYVQLCMTSGYVAKVQPWLLAPTKFLLRIWRWIQVGKVTIIGAENLAVKERVIFCANHSSYLDVIVMHPSLKGPVRYMGAYEELPGCFGLRAILLTSTGSFAVDRKRGSTVIKPTIKLLVNGEKVMMYPEGKIYNNGKFGEFKPGAAIITHGAWKELEQKEPVGIVPIHICYGKRNEKTGNTFSYWKMGLSWRGGVTICVGKPIWWHEHPDLNADQMMALVRSRMLEFKSPTSGE